MKAFVINHVKEDQLPTWFYQVATNYTKLNFDYCMADRFEENADWHFFETTNLNYEHFIDYDMTQYDAGRGNFIQIKNSTRQSKEQ